MPRIVAVLLICLLGCGGGRFQGTFRSGGPVFSVTGFVSFVELTTIPDSTIVVTIVTFLPDFSPATTVIFCGYPTDYGTLKFNPDGQLLWASRYNGPGNGNDGLTALALDTNGNVYVSGRSAGIEGGDDFATVNFTQGPTCATALAIFVDCCGR